MAHDAFHELDADGVLRGSAAVEKVREAVSQFSKACRAELRKMSGEDSHAVDQVASAFAKHIITHDIALMRFAARQYLEDSDDTLFDYLLEQDHGMDEELLTIEGEGMLLTDRFFALYELERDKELETAPLALSIKLKPMGRDERKAVLERIAKSYEEEGELALELERLIIEHEADLIGELGSQLPECYPLKRWYDHLHGMAGPYRVVHERMLLFEPHTAPTEAQQEHSLTK